MMNQSELETVYFPGWYPLRNETMAAACIYFTRVHFVTPAINAGSTDTYTDYLREASKKSVSYQIFGKRTEKTEPNLQRMAQFWRFIQDSGPLMGEVIRYHPNHMDQEVTSIVEKLSGTGLTQDEFEAFFKRGREESEALAECYQGSYVLEDDFLPIILPTARYLAIKHGWIPLSDNPDFPAPVLQDLDSSAEELAASLALRMLTLSLPAPQKVEAELILEVREEMKDELCAFRMMALKLAADLRCMLSQAASRKDVEREAEFLVKTKVMPYVAEIRRRTQMERGKLWRRVFGKTPKWLSLGLACFTDPTGAALATALREASKDTAALLEDTHRLSLAGDPGVALLIRLADGEGA